MIHLDSTAAQGAVVNPLKTHDNGEAMKAVFFEEHGGVDKLLYRDWPDPAPRSHDVVVRVHAVGLHYLDIFVRRGMPNVETPPVHLGQGHRRRD